MKTAGLQVIVQYAHRNHFLSHSLIFLSVIALYEIKIGLS